MKYLLIIIIILNILGFKKFLIDKNIINGYVRENKYLTVTFSNDTLIPEKKMQNGIAGMRHMQILLQQIIYLGVKLNKSYITTSMGSMRIHNNGIPIDTKWKIILNGLIIQNILKHNQ